MELKRRTNTELVAQAVEQFRAQRHAGRAFSLGSFQKATRLDSDPPPGLITLRVTIPVPLRQEIVDIVTSAARDFGDGEEEVPPVQAAALRAEWYGGACKEGASSDMSAKDKYEALKQSVDCSVVTLFLHGGGHL